MYLGTDPSTRRKRRVTRTVRGSRREAERVLAKLLVEVDERQVGGGSGSVADLLTRWQERASGDWSPRTAEVYATSIRLHVLPHVGHVQVERLAVHDLDGLYAQLTRQGLAPATVRKVHTILRSALGQAVRWGWVSRNPAVDASPPKVKSKTLRPPTLDELRTLLARADNGRDPDLGCWLRVAADTGARRGEVCALRWSDVNLETGEVTISRALVHAGSLVVEKGTKTDKPRKVAISTATVAALVSHRARWAERSLASGTAMPEWVFASRVKQGPLRPESITQHFVRLRTGLEHVRLHDLRHYVATTLLGAGVDQRTVMGRLGHASLASLTRYSHFLEAKDREAADTLGDLLAGS